MSSFSFFSKWMLKGPEISPRWWILIWFHIYGTATVDVSLPLLCQSGSVSVHTAVVSPKVEIHRSTVSMVSLSKPTSEQKSEDSYPLFDFAVPLNTGHDICQNFYTSTFSKIKKFTGRKRIIPILFILECNPKLHLYISTLCFILGKLTKSLPEWVDIILH